YLQSARHGYRQWGAAGKGRQLDDRDPHLRDDPPIDPTRTVETAGDHLDLATVLPVSQGGSAETRLPSFIATVIRLAGEHAGAERGLLILPDGDAHRIEAEARIGVSEVAVDLRPMPIAAGQLPTSVFNYVVRTRDRVLLHDAAVAAPFSDDDYVRRHGAR